MEWGGGCVRWRSEDFAPLVRFEWLLVLDESMVLFVVVEENGATVAIVVLAVVETRLLSKWKDGASSDHEFQHANVPQSASSCPKRNLSKLEKNMVVCLGRAM